MMYSNASDTSAESGRGVVEIIIILLMLSIIILLSILGNIAVIFAINTNHHLKDEVSNYFIINLSITDLSSVTIVMTSTLVSIFMDSWQLGEIWCDIVCMANYCLIIVSMLTLCFISVDRYYAVLYPLRYPLQVTAKKVKMAIAYAWFQGVVFATIPIIFRWVKYDYWEAVCAIQWHKERKQALYYVISAFIACFLTPGVIIIVTYTRILRAMKRMLPPQTVFTSISAVKYSTSQKAMNGLLIVVAAFFICMTPFSCTKLYKVVAQSDNALPGYVNLSASLIAYISSAANPFIYGIFRKDFRNAFKLMYKRYIARRSIHSQDIQLSSVTL